MKTLRSSVLRLALVPTWWALALSAALAEGQDIFELLTQGKVEARTRGSGIQSASLELRRTAGEPLTVRIPAGTYLSSRHYASQSMVTTAEQTVALRSDGWVWVSLPAACADRVKDIPTGSVGFDIQRSPNQKELEKLMPLLDKANVSYAVRQAAIWILTDNASYADLGILIRRQGGRVLGRVIGPDDAVMAMRLCHEAGIDITQRTIWRDRDLLRSQVTNEALRRWLDEGGERGRGTEAVPRSLSRHEDPAPWALVKGQG